jgi:tRNA(adenine34) deaminase
MPIFINFRFESYNNRAELFDCAKLAFYHGQNRAHICSMEIFSDEYFMRKALAEAEMAFAEEEIPIGAVVVYENQIIGKGYNQTERLNDVTAHAEMLAITAAANALNSKFLDECTLYVTIEPCCMCAGAISWARFHRVVLGALEPKHGFGNKAPGILGKKTEVVAGILEDECAVLMKSFFARKR